MESTAWPLDGSLLGIGSLILISISLVTFMLWSELQAEARGKGGSGSLLGPTAGDALEDDDSPRGLLERCMQRVELVRALCLVASVSR